MSTVALLHGNNPWLVVTHTCLQARVLVPPTGAVGTQWEVQTDLSEQLHAFLRANNWLVRQKGQKDILWSCRPAHGRHWMQRVYYVEYP